MILLDAGRDLALLGGGAVGALTLEHGWGWVVAQWKARTAKVKAQADSLFTEVTSQVKAAVGPFEARVAALEADMANVKNEIKVS